MSTLNPNEQALLQEFADEMVTNILPGLITDLESKLPAFAQGIVAMMLAPILPGITAQAKAYIDAKIAAA